MPIDQRHHSPGDYSARRCRNTVRTAMPDVDDAPALRYRQTVTRRQ